MTEAPSGHLWLAKEDDGLLHLFQGRVVEKISVDCTGTQRSTRRVVLADPSAARNMAGIQRWRYFLLRRRSDSEVVLGRRWAWRGQGE